VLMTALLRAGTQVLEPVQRVRLEVPTDSVGSVLALLTRLRGIPGRTDELGSGHVIDGEIPAASVHELQQRLPGLTRGEGVAETFVGRHRPVQGVAAPERSRTDDDPRDRHRYLLATTRAAGRPMPPA
jgi:ribosomal protection tetracycline resistance protein